jgi:hypothetical protein
MLQNELQCFSLLMPILLFVPNLVPLRDIPALAITEINLNVQYLGILSPIRDMSRKIDEDVRKQVSQLTPPWITREPWPGTNERGN